MTTNPARQSPLALLLIAYFIFFAMAIPGGILNVAWTYMQTTFGVSLDSLGVLLTANLGGSLLGTFFSGRMIARYGVGRFLAAGSLLGALGLLVYAAAPSWIVLIAAAFLSALGFAVLNAGLNLFVSANYSTGQLTWMHAFFGLGLTVGPALTTLLVVQFRQSWHLAYLIAFVVIAFVALLLLITRSQWVMAGYASLGEANASKVRADTTRVGVWESLRVPAVLLGTATFFTFGGTVWVTGQLSSTLLAARGVDQPGFWVSIYWASFAVGRTIVGFIAHRIENTVLIRICMIGGALGAALLWQSASTTLNLLGLVLIGLACAPLYPTLIAETVRRVGQRHRANTIGFQIAASSLGQALIPGATAWLAQHTVVGVIGVLPVIGVLAVLALNEAAVRRLEQVAVGA